VLTHLFHRVEGRLDGRPTLLIIDEGWLVLDDPAFAQQLREWLKTLRKKNASVVFATQSLSDIADNPIAPAIVESCPTRVFLPNDRAIELQITAIYRRFGLNDRQIAIIARATPKRDYYGQSRQGNRLFELGLGPVALAFCAASGKTDHTAIERVIAQAQTIAYDVERIETAFSGPYGPAAPSSSDAALIADAQTRWKTSVGAFEDSLKTQAVVVGNIDDATDAMTALVSASQSASGALQAAQAGNQLLALQSQQLSDLTALLAAKARADALEQARTASAESQGQVQYRRFSTRSGYVPHAVTMFGE
jgi:hypothetical protein